MWSYLNKPEDNTKNFWNHLATLGNNGAFDKKEVFIGLCEIFVQISTRISEGKSLQNIKYPSQFTNFLAILSSTSPQAYRLFQENLAGRSLRNLR